MDRFKLLAPVIVLAAVIVAAMATLGASPGPGGPAPDAAANTAVAAPTTEPVFISERFEQQKRNAPIEALPDQF